MVQSMIHQVIKLISVLLMHFKDTFWPLNFLMDTFLTRIKKVSVFLISGIVSDQQSFQVIFVGRKESAYQFSYVVFSQINRVKLLGKILIHQIENLSQNEEIVVVQIKNWAKKKYVDQGYFLLPYISFTLNLHNSLNKITKKLSRRRRRDLKKIRELDYSFKISRNNENDLQFFYQKMFLPTTKKRFNKAAKLLSLAELRITYRKNGGILFLKRKEKILAGLLFQIKGKSLFALRAGVYEGEQGLLRNFTSQATLFYLIKWAKKHGIKNLNYGITMPFFNDGVFIYKKEWGMLLEEQINQPIFALKFPNLNEKLLLFLFHNPFIFLEGKKIRGLITINHKLHETELLTLSSRYLIPNVDSLLIIAYYSRTEDFTKLRSEYTFKFYDNQSNTFSNFIQNLHIKRYNVDAFILTKSFETFKIPTSSPSSYSIKQVKE